MTDPKKALDRLQCEIDDARTEESPEGHHPSVTAL